MKVIYLILTGLRLEEANDTGLLGDVNSDGSIDSTDLQLVKRHILNKRPLEGMGLINADVNRDKSVDSTDVTLLKRYILRKIESFDF